MIYEKIKEKSQKEDKCEYYTLKLGWD